MTLLKGSCMCGAVQYETNAESVLSFICQYRDYQIDQKLEIKKAQL